MAKIKTLANSVIKNGKLLPTKANFLIIGKVVFYTCFFAFTINSVGLFKELKNVIQKHDEKLAEKIISSINSNINHNNMVLMHCIDSARYQDNQSILVKIDKIRSALRMHVFASEKDSKHLREFLEVIYADYNLQNVHYRRDLTSDSNVRKLPAFKIVGTKVEPAEPISNQ
jgi:hypothetical protein